MVTSERVSPVDDRVLRETIRIHPVKAAFDKVFALMVLVLLASLGPIFYKEARVSQDRVFDL